MNTLDNNNAAMAMLNSLLCACEPPGNYLWLPTEKGESRHMHSPMHMYGSENINELINVDRIDT